MAIVRAVKSGNWSDATVWSTGALPTSADDVYSNTFQVTIDIDPTVISIRTGSTTGVTAGGNFNVTSGDRIITASLFAGTGSCLIIDGSANYTTVVGNVTGGTASSVYGIIYRKGGLTVNGNVASGSGTNAHGIDVQNSGGWLIINGNCTATYGNAIVNRVAAVVYVQNGTCTGSSVAANQPCISNLAGGSIYALECAFAPPGSSSGSHVIVNSSSGYVEINAQWANYTASGSCILVNNGSGTAFLTAASLTGGTTANVVGVSNAGTGSLYVTANVNGGSASGAYGVYSANSAYTYIYGKCTGSAVTAAYLTATASSGASDITGNCTGGTATSIYGIHHGGGGILNISGNCTAGTGTSSVAVYNGANGTVNITGTCTASAGDAVYNNAGGSISITGECRGSTTANRHGVHNASTGTVSIQGTCTGGNANPSYGAYNASTGRINITGMVVGNSTSSTSLGAYNASTGTIEHLGQVMASSVAAGIGSVFNGTLLLTGPFTSASNGCQPISAPKWQWAQIAAGFTYYENYKPDLTLRQLLSIESFASGTPAASNVRSGTVYGANNSLTGTLAVPPAGSVLLGVPVDNTTGTATITGASIRSALGMSSANLDTQLSGLNTNLAAVPAAVWAVLTSSLTTAGSIGKLLVDNINATIGSRSTYTGGDTAGTTTLLSRLTSGRATALDNLDATISSRLATSAYSMPPSVATIASQVRTELSTELDRIDAAVSSRLATTGYTTPPTAAAITTAVWAAADKVGYSLTSAERQAIATAVEQSILNENDGQAILNAIVGAIGNQNIDQIALVAAVRADLERTGGTLATRSTLTAAQVRTELAPELSNLDATVSSRLAVSGYTAPPSAASIATAVWTAATRTLTTAIDNSSTIAAAVWSTFTRTLTANPGPTAADNATAVRQELNTELNRIDANISSRVKPADTLARVTLVDTTTNLTNEPDVPTEVEIADAVRSELGVELSRLDAAVSSRLKPTDTLARVTLVDAVTSLVNTPDVPSEIEIAEAVRDELAPELNRLSNAATTQEVGDIIESALQAPPEP